MTVRDPFHEVGVQRSQDARRRRGSRRRFSFSTSASRLFAEWQGPCRDKYDHAKKDADEHNKKFPEHGARVMSVTDCNGGA
jgi:hypothetical protein